MSGLPFQIVALLVVGFISGFLNILAGGGSLLTLPLLIFLGLPAAVANGTNRVGVLCQNIFAITSFRRQGIFPWRLALFCSLPAIAGSYLGARLAVDIDERLFQRLLAGIMLGVLVLTLVDPMKKRRVEELVMTPGRGAVLLASFFFIGIYGGFVQAGVGFLIIPALVLHGIDLVRTNVVKIIVVLIFTIPALAVFMAHDQVNWTLGLALAAGNSAGGWVASRMAVKKGHDWIKQVVALTVFVFALKLLFS
ncbi:sulfite exporter TauE/SafE family protein [Desulfuromonas carbonis]|uniref:sulfite exporter TauE/SafE family protein n=1 Tax=Desulfuromonas sp. DDH964 TaxID=1823759 RepID=UPI00078DF260|nr:sulfite exporter TauE/SafE family protein [Desulfuromonas sp. DDH964]AMV73921.1 integrase [Desulfuromonas sp. DDH964]